MSNNESLDMNIVISQKKIAVLKLANEKWQESRSEQKICKLTVCRGQKNDKSVRAIVARKFSHLEAKG